MAVEEDGLTGLFSELCRHHLLPKTPYSLPVLPSVKGRQQQSLRKLLYSVLFQFHKGPHCQAIRQDNVHSFTLLDNVYIEAYNMRCHHKFDDANRLEHLTETFLADGCCDVREDLLKLLLCLAGSVQPHRSVVGAQLLPLPLRSQNKFSEIPDEVAICYGDSSLQRLNGQRIYMQYPREIFEVEGLRDKSQFDPKIFESTPGTDLKAGVFFNANDCVGEGYERGRRERLCGALVHSTVTSIATRLDIPQLCDAQHEDTFHFKLANDDSKDEGFAEDEVSSCSTATPVVERESEQELESEPDIWKLAAEQPAPPKYCNWETVGSRFAGEEKPYVTEAGPAAFDHLYCVYMDRLRQVDSSITCPLLTYISMKTFVRDVLNLLVGVPSDTFPFDQATCEFSLKRDVCLSGLSTEALANASGGFLRCGVAYLRLHQFAQPPSVDSFDTTGLVSRAFRAAICRYLQYYVGCVLSVAGDSLLLQLHERLGTLQAQMRFLSELCRISGNEKEKDDEKLPAGVELISYLYDSALAVGASPHYPVLLCLLQAACVPYMLFVQRWVFYGSCQDAYNEFIIQTNDSYLQFRDRHYWTDSYTLSVSGETGRPTPAFLSDLANEIFVCGKSLNLLRCVSPQHFLFFVECEVPCVRILFSEASLKRMEEECSTYGRQLTETARLTMVNRERLLAERRQKEKDLLVKARQHASQQIDRLKANIVAKRQALADKKKRLFSELKDQMELDLQRRASREEEEKREDVKRMEDLTHQELLEGHIEREVEAQARKELVEHYAKLSEAASLREQRAHAHILQRKMNDAHDDFDPLSNANLQPHAGGGGGHLDPNVDAVRRTTEDGGGDSAGMTSDTVQGAASPDDTSPVVSPLTAGESGAGRAGGLPKWAEKRLAVMRDGLVGTAAREQLTLAGDKRPLLSLPGVGVASDSNAGGNVAPRRVADETEESVELRHLKLVGDHRSGVETSPQVALAHTQTVAGSSVGRETVESVALPQVKSIDGFHVSVESEAAGVTRSVDKTTGRRVGDECEATSPRAAPQANVHGHVSEQSEGGACTLLRLKHSADKHVGQRSTETRGGEPARRRSVPGRDISDETVGRQVEPLHRQPVPGCDVGRESREADSAIPHFSGGAHAMHATKEAQYVDVDSIRKKRFREINVHGHSSDSSIEWLLYGRRIGQTADGRAANSDQDVSVFQPDHLDTWISSQVEPYPDNFAVLDDSPYTDLMGRVRGSDDGAEETDDTEDAMPTHELVPLPMLLRRSIRPPLTMQIKVVNESLLNYFTVELGIDRHFEALRQFLLMQDGEFGQTLCDQLSEKLAVGMQVSELLNPVHLNAVLNNALRSSLCGDSPYADNISFALKFIPPVLQQNASTALDCLELSYKVDWPLNIVISEAAVSKYSLIFSFFLKLKRVSWVLSDVWHKLKRDAMINRMANNSQCRRLQLCRHEMQLFVKVIQNYIANQIIDVTWREFEADLQDRVHNLDDLHDRHMEYLNKCLFRCLLNPKAAPIMKIIQDIFSLILKFRSQLVIESWQRDPDSGALCHPGFKTMLATYKSFNDYSRFLFKVVSKLPLRGYQPHLEELLLRLNYNNYYKQED